MKIDIWADIVCPYCHLGKARFEAALAQFPHAAEIDVTWHSFELDRSAEPIAEGTLSEGLAVKYGITDDEAVAQHEAIAEQAQELGLDFQWRRARRGNTFDAHRLVHLAADLGLEQLMLERLMRAYFTEGEPIGDRATLVRLAAEVGLDAGRVATMLDSDDYGNHVRSDEATASMIGVTGVPFFVLDRKYGVSGAQPVPVFAQALQQAWDRRHEEPEPAMAGGGCCGGSCGCGAGGCGDTC
ncbi:MAG: DsbA family oxidoreductase [Intrasporangium sp.]|uniref:DsbA family oxidoreductase n=1 Tax=Intrasporangium sp. TaxID=1925024 RepID=UPI0026478C23|nr:DsbA family oxidoreductase [Intrasporangium sp.]MDN5795143.1 DsbA family oxidoreductase [Intrasporangium sp.]